jgi:glycosyltransferase involved in cell wall biosynthesis
MIFEGKVSVGGTWRTNMRKIVVLTLVAHYLPGFKSGGPLRTISNMVERMGDEFEFRIITSDRDGYCKDGKPYEGVTVNAWNRRGGASVFYAAPQSLSFQRVRSLLVSTDYNVLYLNSFFDPIFSIKPLVLRRLGLLGNKPVVIAPRGEFSEGALGIKPLKKSSFLKAAKIAGLHKSVTWQASSEYEAADIERVMGRVAGQIFIACDLAGRGREGKLSFSAASGEHDAPLRVCFVSRITAKKNLDYALRVLQRVRTPVQFSVYGPHDDDQHWRSCLELFEQLPPNVSVRYLGPIEHNRVAQVFAAQDLFLFPTRGENYGHVIHESLSVGTPVLLSDQTPWRGLEAEGVGWDLSLGGMESFCSAIESLANTKVEARMVQRRRAWEYARRVGGDEAVLSANCELFRRAIGGVDCFQTDIGSPPSKVLVFPGKNVPV